MRSCTRMPFFNKLIMAFKSQLEIFVERYVFNVSKYNTIRTKKNLILKALYMVDAQFGIPCCDNPLATTSYTREDDILTNFLRNYFSESFNVRKNTNSLNRVKKLLSKALGRYITEYPYANVDVDGNIVDSCCLVMFTFGDLNGDAVDDIANFTISLIDNDSGAVVIPPVAWVLNDTVQIPKGNYKLEFTRSIAYAVPFDIMSVAVRESVNNTALTGLTYPGDAIDQLGTVTSPVFSVQTDVYATYTLGLEGDLLLFEPPI